MSGYVDEIKSYKEIAIPFNDTFLTFLTFLSKFVDYLIK